MKTVFTILITLQVALHAILGCCAHHAHEDHVHQPPPDAVHQVVQETKCGCGGHSRHDEESARHDHTPAAEPSDASEPSNPPCRHECQGAKCKAVVSKTATPDWSLAVDFASLAEVATDVFQDAVAVDPSSCRPNSRPPRSPLRVHQLCQVFLN
ncbi:MAG: hypothetical protein N2C14_01690 [Planctomycetales bacterium]